MGKGVNARVSRSPRGRLVHAFQGMKRKRNTCGQRQSLEILNFEAEWRSYGRIVRKWLMVSFAKIETERNVLESEIREEIRTSQFF